MGNAATVFEGDGMLAKRMSYLQASGIRKMFEMAAGMKSPIDLSLGQADFDAPEPVKQAAIEAIKAGKNRYSVTTGIPQLLEAIFAALKNEAVVPESAIVVGGASAGLQLALLALVDETSDVLICDPCFVSYPNMIKLTGATPRWIDTYPDFKLTPEKLRAAATARSKVLLFNSPGNPTGIAYTGAEMKALAAAAQSMGITVISDEVYDIFSYDFPHECWLKYDTSAVLVRSFSKTGGIPGWRAGYVAGPQQIVDAIKMLQQFTFVCVNTPAQWASIEALKIDMSPYCDAYRQKRDMVVNALSGSYKFTKPQGAFYIYPEIPGKDPDVFLKKCIENELLIVPGSTFSQRNTHFRISYALDDATLSRGLELLVKIAGQL